MWKIHKRPIHAGEILLEEFLKPLGMTQTDLAKKMKVPVQSVNAIVRGRRAVTASTALALSRIFGTTPELWLNLQRGCDLWDAEQEGRRKKVG